MVRGWCHLRQLLRPTDKTTVFTDLLGGFFFQDFTFSHLVKLCSWKAIHLDVLLLNCGTWVSYYYNRFSWCKMPVPDLVLLCSFVDSRLTVQSGYGPQMGMRWGALSTGFRLGRLSFLIALRKICHHHVLFGSFLCLSCFTKILLRRPHPLWLLHLGSWSWGERSGDTSLRR